MRLLVSGLAGVAVAALIFASVIVIVSINTVSRQMSPKVLLGVSTAGEGELLRLEGPKGVVYGKSIDAIKAMLNPTCILNVTVYEFTTPLGSGSQADLVVTVMSKLNLSQMYYVSVDISNFADTAEDFREIWGSGGINFVDGGLEWAWAGNIDANSSKTFSFRINATGVGLGFLRVSAKMTPEPYLYLWVDMTFVVTPDNIFVMSASYPVFPLIPYFFFNVDVWEWWPSNPWLPGNGGVGTELNVSALIGSDTRGLEYLENVTTKVTYKLVLQEGIIPVQGPTIWSENVTTGEELRRLFTIIRFVKTGNWFMYAYIEKDGILLAAPKVIEFVVTENDIIEHTLL